MTEVSEQINTRRSPLNDVHERLNATMIEQGGWCVPASYGEVAAEYAAVREGGAGLFDLSPRGRILVGGSEAVQFLNGLITNDMKTLGENSWMPAVFPNVQGRLIAAVRVVRLKDDRTDKNVCPAFLLDTEPATHERVLKTIERFTMAGDFRVNDITGKTAQISVQGKAATGIVSAVAGEAAGGLGSNGVVQISRQGHEVTVVRVTHTGEDGFDLIADAERAAALWNALREAGASPVGYEALEMLRIEAGIARYGIDMDDASVVSELNLDDAVSFTKGCYLGQEIIIRIKHRGHVAKKLAGLMFEGAAKVEVGAVVKSADGREAGRVTSVTYSPRLGRTIALGYLKYDYLASGTSVRISAGDQDLVAQVTELPFVRGTAQ